MSQFSIPEVKVRLSRLARVEIVRLDRLTGLYAAGLGRDAIDELLGEAISRVLDARRAWPRDLGLHSLREGGADGRVAGRLFQGRRDLVLLVIDPELVTAQIHCEDGGSGNFYPHVYRSLNVSAVTAVIAFTPNAGGTFELRAGP